MVERERNTTTTLPVRFRRTTAAPSTNLYTIFLLSSRGFHRWCLFRHPTPTTLARFRSSSPAIHFRSSSLANEKSEVDEGAAVDEGRRRLCGGGGGRGGRSEVVFGSRSCV
ncbi:hypothetical protein E3N88_42832 [Mikania micrantha]|uniref:Uncharacterized protein n=1 Tax=Mikania micrantha TaxID=192012 RepID=A0A5N6LGL4_9ASTR|nr:hypothetical protein E3N88_42832 [Mikania micrantha]